MLDAIAFHTFDVYWVLVYESDLYALAQSRRDPL